MMGHDPSSYVGKRCSAYAGSARSKKCPGHCRAEGGCRWWWDISGEDEATGKKLAQSGCGMVLMPILLVETMRMADFASVDADRAGNESVRVREALAGHANAVNRAVVMLMKANAGMIEQGGSEDG